MALGEGRVGDECEPLRRVHCIVRVGGPEPPKPRVIDEPRGEDLRDCFEVDSRRSAARCETYAPTERFGCREPGYGSPMYIGGGVLVLILIILAIIYFAKRV